MYKESKIELDKSETTTFSEGLRGRVFHVTYASNLVTIKKDGLILVNVDLSLTTTFGDSKNSFYRLKDCVSVFDYESPTDKKWDNYMGRCHPFNPQRGDLAFLFLSDKAKKNLIRWGEAKKSWTTERVVPHVEAGHKGNILMSNISEIVVVKVNVNPHSLLGRIEQAHKNAKEKNIRSEF